MTKSARRLLLVTVLALLLVATLALAACDFSFGNGGWGSVFTVQTAYAEAQGLGYTGSLEEFIASISGKDGSNGVDGVGIKSVVVNAEGHLVVTLSNNIDIDCGSVKGEKGDQGPQGEKGDAGADGITPQLKVGADNFWYVSYDNGATWTSLNVKATGADGAQGEKGEVGEKGDTGVSIVSTAFDSNGNTVITYSDGTTQTVEHSWEKFQTVNEADCTHSGNAIYYCADCGLMRLVTAPALGHDIVQHAAKAATCTSIGWEAYETCSRCDHTTYVAIPKLAHNFVDGFCSVCGTEDLEEATGLIYELSEDGNYYIIVGIGTETRTKFAIPSEYNGKPVKEIGEEAFVECDITAVEIPSSIVTIGESAFCFCTGLSKITIPSGVNEVGDTAFAGCELESITVEEGNTVYHVDGNCLIETATKTIVAGFSNSVIPTDGSVTAIGEYAFAACNGLEKVEIPDCITKIGNGAFVECENIEEVTIPTSVIEVGSYIFDADNLTIYCAAESRPEGWHKNWQGSDCTVYWNGVKEEVYDDTYAHTIIFYSTQGSNLRDVTQKAIDAFEAKYPEWNVIHVVPGGYDDVKDKIISDFQGAVQPDIAYCYADHVAQYIQTSKVLNLNQFVNSTQTVTDANGNSVAIGYSAEELADFVSAFYNEGIASNMNGYSTYGYSASDLLTMPFVKSTELLYYNKTALDACGLSVATTWDELWSQAATIKAKYPMSTVLGYDNEANWFITTCKQNGWGYTNANSTNHYMFNGTNQANWLDTLNEYYENGWITTMNDYGAYTSGLFTKGVENDAGGVVYCVASSGSASHQNPGDKFEWGVAPIPGTRQEDGSVDYSTLLQGPSLVMFNSGHNVPNADEKQLYTWLFMKELLDPDFQAEFAISSGYMPSRSSSYENETYKSFLEGDDIVVTSAKVAGSNVENLFSTPAIANGADVREEIGEALRYAMIGMKSGAKALEDAYKTCCDGSFDAVNVYDIADYFQFEYAGTLYDGQECYLASEYWLDGARATISWQIPEAYSAILAFSNGTLTVTTDAEVTAKIKATFTCDGESCTKTYTVQVAKTKPPKVCYLDAVVDWPTVDTTYKLALWQGNKEQVLYATGAMSGNYLAMSDKFAEAADLTLEAATGGYYLNLGGKYITLTGTWNSRLRAGISLTENASTVFTIGGNGELIASVSATDDSGELQSDTYWIGTYSTWTMISASATGYIADTSNIDNSQFPARIVANAEIIADTDSSDDVDGDSGDDSGSSTDPTPSETVTTIAGALAAATGTAVEITGTVSSIKTEWNTTFKNMSVYVSDGTNQILLYRTTTQVEVGNVVSVSGTVDVFNGTVQIKNSTVTIVSSGSSTTPDDGGSDEVGDDSGSVDSGEIATITFAEAAELAGTEKNVYTSEKYCITGTVAEIKNATYGNMTIEDGDGNTFYIYGSYDATGTNRYDAMTNPPQVGDVVVLWGVLGYYANPQMKNAWIISSYTPEAGGSD